jgi:D-alanyl-lipoteichoic acid acyltransferase DltB (MBOAT superfamily)
MSFVSFEFVALMLATLGAYHLAHRSLWLQNGIVLLASMTFYASWNVRFLGLLLVMAGANFLAAWGMEAFGRWRKTILVTGIAGNLALLGVFKYANFFIDSLFALLAPLGLAGGELHIVGEIVLPLGISFFTFQKIAYLVDVYRGDVPAERSPVVFLCFVLFFPQLIAGPIERASHLMPQFKTVRIVSFEGGAEAVWLICWGLFLKIAVADSLSHAVDNAFRPDQQFGWSVILGTLAFGLQIYADFCGYSFMAKGLAALLGFELAWNFLRPYASLSIQEFWQRWHVTLGRWLRDYLYIPLGGNRQGKTRTEINLLLTMALGGLWHGASWSFVAWGAFHGLALVVHRRWRALDIALPKLAAWLLTVVTVMAGWFLFRAQSGVAAVQLLATLSDLGWRPGHTSLLVMLIVLCTPIVLVEMVQERADDPYILVRHGRAWTAIVSGAAVLGALSLIGNVQSKFIYFQF